MVIAHFPLLLISLLDPAAIINGLTVAVGLGLVIFFHELGHFAVAKWCGVYVERFSIGLGHPIFRRKYGETEYAIGWLPFGGYVKMLGQDDMDPGQMVDEHLAENPRAYSAKNVPQRMAIISAGVIMNIITGLMFFTIAFSWGVEAMDRTVGSVQVGMPAWVHGLRAGDVITGINNHYVADFSDIKRGTALSRGSITLSGKHPNDSPFSVQLEPEQGKILRIIGVGPAQGLQFLEASSEAGMPIPTAYPGTAAARADFKNADRIVALDGQPVTGAVEMNDYLARHAAVPVEFTVERPAADKNAQPTQEKIRVFPEKFRTFGLRMSMGKVVALKDDSLAAKAGIKVGDRIAMVDERDVGVDLDPFRLTEYFSEHAGQEVVVTLIRDVPNSAPENLPVKVTPEDVAAWSEPPEFPESPLSIPSLGLAYHIVPNVFSVEADGPAAAAGIQKLDTVSQVTFTLGTDVKFDGLGDEAKHTVEVGETGWAYAYWMMQNKARSRNVSLTIKPATNPSELKTIDNIVPAEAADWYCQSNRGLLLQALTTTHKADNLQEALAMGWHTTSSNIVDIYLTLRGLITGDISRKGLSGPLGIASMAFDSARSSFIIFIMFLGIISINLAVINFLPIPVLDGGHMVFLLWEGITRRRPSERVQITATWFGICFLASLMLFVIFQDLQRWFVPTEF